MSKVPQHIYEAALQEVAVLRKTNKKLFEDNLDLKSRYRNREKEYTKLIAAISDLTNALYDLLKAGEKKAPEKKFKAKNLYDKKLWKKAWRAYENHGIPF